MLKKILTGFAGLVALLIVALAVVYLATGPESPPSDSLSAAALEGGPFPVGDVQITFVDETRPTKENGDFPGAESRTLVTTIWYPEGDPADRYPLVIYSHGFMSSRDGGNYLARALASHGYVVASADFPLTNMAAPGGPEASDVSNQPGDVSFLIDSLIGLEGESKPFAGEIDQVRIGVMGLSLGGLTSTLATYHPRWRDKRIKAAVSIAGPAVMFTRRFFLNSSAPLLMIGATQDAIVDYQANAAIIPELSMQGTLLSIEGGSHTGFVSLAEPGMRFFDHPDSIGCDAIRANFSEAPDEDPFSHLGGPEDGVNLDKRGPPLCSQPLIKSLHPGRQQMIAQLGVLSFFQSVLAAERDERSTARQLLIEGIPKDFPEASITL